MKKIKVKVKRYTAENDEHINIKDEFCVEIPKREAERSNYIQAVVAYEIMSRLDFEIIED